jgi:hypothetical protein
VTHVRLNFVLPTDLDADLAGYCAETGRKATGVIRQLVVEWLEGDLSLPERASEHPEGRRTNILLPPRVADALDARRASEGHVTRAAVIEALLRRFLVRRRSSSGDTLTVRVRLPVDLFNELATVCKAVGLSVEEALVADAQARASKAVTALKKELMCQES